MPKTPLIQAKRFQISAACRGRICRRPSKRFTRLWNATDSSKSALGPIRMANSIVERRGKFRANDGGRRVGRICQKFRIDRYSSRVQGDRKCNAEICTRAQMDEYHRSRLPKIVRLASSTDNSRFPNRRFTGIMEIYRTFEEPDASPSPDTLRILLGVPSAIFAREEMRKNGEEKLRRFIGIGKGQSVDREPIRRSPYRDHFIGWLRSEGRSRSRSGTVAGAQRERKRSGGEFRHLLQTVGEDRHAIFRFRRERKTARREREKAIRENRRRGLRRALIPAENFSLIFGIRVRLPCNEGIVPKRTRSKPSPKTGTECSGPLRDRSIPCWLFWAFMRS